MSKKKLLFLFTVSTLFFTLLPARYAHAKSSYDQWIENSFTSTSTIWSSGKGVSTTYYHDNAFADHILLKGIDVSWWQSDDKKINTRIDWKAAHNDGIDFAFIRIAARDSSTGELFTDTGADSHITNALKNKVNIGVYIFSQAITVTEAKEEAYYVLDILNEHDWDVTLPVVFDYEYRSVKENGKETGRLISGKLSKNTMTNICSAFCSIIRDAGYRPAIYANYNMLTNDLNTAKLAQDYSIWLARYNITTTSYRSTSSTLTPYSDLFFPYEFWQFTSSGKVDGYSSNLDCDYWYKNTKIKTNNLTAYSQNGTSITLDWDDAETADMYRIYRYDKKQDKYVKLADVKGTTYKDTGLSPNTEYSYKVRCFWKIGGTNYLGKYSDALTTYTSPSKVSDMDVETLTNNSITLTWKKSKGASGYRIYQYNTDTGTYQKLEDVTGVTSYKVTGLTSAKEYKFKIRPFLTVKGKKYLGAYSDAFAACTKAGKVTSLTVTPASAKSVTLTFNKVSRASGYQIYRYDSDADMWRKIASIKGNSQFEYTDTGLLTCKEYQYKVRAYKTYNGKTLYGSFSTPTAGITKPAQVTVTATSSKKKTVTLSWTKASRVSGYRIYRYDEDSESWVRIAEVTGNKTFTYTDTTVSGVEYQYKVRGYKTYNKKTYYGLYSKVVTVTSK